MCSEELYNRFASFLNFKETQSREKHKTRFGSFRTIDLNLWVELTKSFKCLAQEIQFNRFFNRAGATSFKLPAASFKLRATSFKLRAASFKL
jgi:hypothetical protein